MSREKTINAFQSAFVLPFDNVIREPNSYSKCKVIDPTRIIVEVITNFGNFSDSDFSQKMLLDGDFALVVRYYRENDTRGIAPRPTCALSFEIMDDGTVIVKQLQGSKDKHIAYRFASSFDSVSYFSAVLEEAFIKKWISVEVERFPTGIEGASYTSGAIDRYHSLASLVSQAKLRHKK